MTNDLGTFTISAEWMKACGYGDEARTVDVLRIMEFPGRGEGFERFFKVDMGGDRTWVVAELRGTYLPFVTDLNRRVAEEGGTVFLSVEEVEAEWKRQIAALERPGGCGAARVDFFAHLEDDKLVCDEPKADMSGRLMTAGDAEAFILAGKATVTLVSLKTGTRFTYRISASPDKSCHFVALLAGADNEGDYKYLGRIARSMFWAGRRVPKAGDIGRDAPSMRAFAWAWQAIVRGALPEQLEIWHEGRCGRCARKLTVPSSIASGFGPECITRMG